MKLGMPSLIEFKSIEENILLCKELGLDFVEINMNMSYCLPEYNDSNHLNKLLNENNIGLTMHFPEEIDFGTPFSIIKEANIKLFENFCMYGSRIKVEKINIHLLPGTVVTLPTKKVYAYEMNKNLFFKNLTESLAKVIHIANQYNIKVCVENTNVPEFLVEAIGVLSNIDHLYFTYDIGHDAKGNYNVEKIFKGLDKKVSHMHFHDFDGKTDHQTLFKGNIDLIDRYNFAKTHDMTVVVEVKTQEALRQSIEELIKRNLV